MTAVALLLAACGDSPKRMPGPAPEPDAPRGAHQLLVEELSRAGARAYYLMEPDGSRVSRFPSVASDVLRVIPAPDGRTLALLVLAPSFDVELWLADRDGSNRRPLLAGAREVASAAWSSDGRHLAVQQSTTDGETDIWVVGADGSEPRNLTADPRPAIIFDRAPTWSPDGTRIAFSSDRGSGTRLWVMAADGSDPRQLVPDTLESTETEPAWSPDGSLVAFLGGTVGAFGVGVVRPDGSGYRSFAVAGDVRRPAWSPDGRLLYAANPDANYELFALDPSTGRTENLTRHLGDDLGAVVLRHVEPPPWRGFGAPARYQVSRPGVPGLAAGDFDGDGLADLALLDAGPGQVRLLEGTGGGAFGPSDSLDAPLDQRAVAAAELDGAVGVDLVVLGAQTVEAWRGGPSWPGQATTLPLLGQGRGLAVADFSWSGESQVAAVVEGPGTAMRVLLFGANGAGELVALVDLDTGFSSPGQACAADFTGEGSMDLLVATRDAEAPLVLVPTEGISFAAPVVAATGVAVDAAVAPVCADLDGDRRADVVLLRPGSEAGVAALESAGLTVGPAVELPIQGSALAAMDADQDGDVDLVVAREAPRALLFLRNRGDGRFASPAELDRGGAPRHLAAADLDGDGWPDLAVIDADGSLGIRLNLRR